MERGDVQNRDQQPVAPGFLGIGNTFRCASAQEGSLFVARCDKQRQHGWRAERSTS